MAGHERLQATFAEATAETLRVMAGVEVVPSENSTATCDLFAVLPLTDGPVERLVLSFPNETAQALALRILEVSTPSVEMVRDCMGEFANVVAGQAKAMLFGTPDHFRLSVPQVFDRLEPSLVPLEQDVGLNFNGEIGPFSLHLKLAATDGGTNHR